MFRKIKKPLIISTAVVLPVAAIAAPVAVSSTKKADAFLPFIALFVSGIPKMNFSGGASGVKYYRNQQLISQYQEEVEQNIYGLFWSDTVVWKGQSYSEAKTSEKPFKLEQVKKIHLSGVGSPSLSIKGSVGSSGPSMNGTLDIKTEVSSKEVSDSRQNTRKLFSDHTVDGWIWKITSFDSDVVSLFYFGNSTYSVSAKLDKGTGTKKYSI